MTRTQAARDAYVDATAGDAPAFNAPHSRADLRKLEDTAHNILGMAEIIANRVENLSNGRCGFGYISRQDLALSMAEALDPHMTSEAVGVVFAEIKAACGERAAA